MRWILRNRTPEDHAFKLRLDLRGPDIGDFVLHGHVLSHEDAGMMAIKRIQTQLHVQRRESAFTPK